MSLSGTKPTFAGYRIQVRLPALNRHSGLNVGLDDLVCQVEAAEFLIEPGEGTAELTAETFDGTPIQGTDSIRIVPH